MGAIWIESGIQTPHISIKNSFMFNHDTAHGP
jgi:hypothetical protein